MIGREKLEWDWEVVAQAWKKCNFPVPASLAQILKSNFGFTYSNSDAFA